MKKKFSDEEQNSNVFKKTLHDYTTDQQKIDIDT